MASEWPRLAFADWRETQATLHMLMQIVGKTRLALAPMMNHWWQSTLYVSSRGMTTSAMPYRGGLLEAEFDFMSHSLALHTSEGESRTIPLLARPVAEFYADYRNVLHDLGVEVRMYPVPSEVQGAIPFSEDRTHVAYDPDAAHRFWRVLIQADRVLKEFRGRFIGKCSPVHFFWGAFDLACTRFSGRRAPEHPGGIPNCPDYVTREAYSHECISAGWWPGGGPVADAAFYCYAYPEPLGYADAVVLPAEASYDRKLREFILPYEAVRTAAQPDELLMDFFQSTYEAAAELGRWDRAALERSA